MSINGRINLITDPTAFFLPVILGTGQPTSGFTPATDLQFTVKMTGLFFGIFQFSVSTNVDTSTGKFSLPDFPSELGLIDLVWLNVTHQGRPFYRSEMFPRSHTNKDLEIFVNQPVIPNSDGVSAGQISTGLASAGLPGNTTLTANSWGIGVAGSQSGADVQFGIQLVPDVSPNLAVFFDLALDGWNIHVGFPADWCTSANDILNNIKSQLQTSGSTANKLVAGTIATAFEGPPLNLSSAVTTKLLNAVSIQFVTMNLPNKHSWALSNHGDKTIVVVPQLTVGFPRGF